MDREPNAQWKVKTDLASANVSNIQTEYFSVMEIAKTMDNTFKSVLAEGAQKN